MKINKDKTLQDARQTWLFDKISEMKLESPLADLVRKTGYSKSVISMMLNNKAAISINFLKKFCEAFGFDFDAVNHTLIDKIKTDLSRDNINEKSKTKIDNFNSIIDKENGQKSKQDDNEIITLDFHENIPKMIDKLLSIHEKNSASMANMSEANVIMARAVEALIIQQKEGEQAKNKRQAS
jgi:transcriptional regulator with XRE-family HTH domain